MTGAVPIFSPARFRAEREADWAEFAALLARLEGKSAAALSSEELLRLPILYRATLSSLSIARATSLDRALLEYLEALAMRGYFLIYGVRERRRDRIAGFFRHGWPAAVQALGRETLVILLVLLLGLATGWAMVASNPEFYYQLMPEAMAGGRDPAASADYLRSTLAGGGDGDKSGLHIFATSLFTHNSGVAIFCFALGFAFGLPTMILVYYQGLILGAMMAVFAAKGLTVDFSGWLAIHGTTELFAIVLAGAAGLRIGTAVLFPGERDRLTAAARAGRSAGTAMIGVILMLLAAGLLEGFGRQMIGDTGLRYAVGGAMLALWLAYFYRPARGAPVGPPAS